MTVFTVHEAKTNLSKLMTEVMAGGDVVIARGKVPAVRLIPVAVPAKREFGALKGRITLDASFSDPLPAEEIEAWDGQ